MNFILSKCTTLSKYCLWVTGCSHFNIVTSVNCTLCFFLVHSLLWALRLMHFLIFIFFYLVCNMLAFLRFLSWQSDICSFVSRVSQIAHSHRDITLLALLSCIYSFFRALLLMLTVLVSHFCWQLPNLFFCLYHWPCPGSPFAVPDCLRDISGLNWCHQTFSGWIVA